MKDKKIDNYIGVKALIFSTILMLLFCGLVKAIDLLPMPSKTPILSSMVASVIDSEPLQNADGYMIIICDPKGKVHFCLSNQPYSVGDSVQVSYINNNKMLKYKLN